MFSWLAQRERVGLITQRSKDRNLGQLNFDTVHYLLLAEWVYSLNWGVPPQRDTPPFVGFANQGGLTFEPLGTSPQLEEYVCVLIQNPLLILSTKFICGHIFSVCLGCTRLI